MKLLAAGLNHHGELTESREDIHKFTQIADDVSKVAISTWFSLATLGIDGTLRVKGRRNWTYKSEHTAPLQVFVRNRASLMMVFDSEERMHIRMPGENFTTYPIDAPYFKKLGWVAMAGNGRIAFIQSMRKDTKAFQIGETKNLEDFLAWYMEPEYERSKQKAHKISWHMVIGRPKQLVSSLGSFALLLEDGSLFTWGDPRYRTLGREFNPDGPDKGRAPALVDALDGVKIKQIALGGWMGGAVSEDGALYLWGSSQPGQSHELDCLSKLNSETRVALVSLAGDPEEEPTVTGIAIGHGHAILTTADGRVFGAGENGHGQLGLEGADFRRTWTLLDAAGSITEIVCGPKTTLLLME